MKLDEKATHALTATDRLFNNQPLAYNVVQYAFHCQEVTTSVAIIVKHILLEALVCQHCSLRGHRCRQGLP